MAGRLLALVVGVALLSLAYATRPGIGAGFAPPKTVSRRQLLQLAVAELQVQDKQELDVQELLLEEDELDEGEWEAGVAPEDDEGEGEVVEWRLDTDDANGEADEGEAEEEQGQQNGMWSVNNTAGRVWPA